jgi:predicted aspartyl protease
MHERWVRTGKAPNLILALLAGLLLAAMLRAAGAQPANLGAALRRLGYEQIELRRTGEHHLFLFGQVNGRRRSCLVDTGWSFTTISTNTTQRLAVAGIVDELKLGRVSLTNEPAVVQALRVNGRPTSFDMVLGCDFLIRHHAMIDGAGRRLYLRSEALDSERMVELAAVLQRRGFVAEGMTRRDPLSLTCAAKLNGHDVELLVDTGAMWSCLDTATARALELRTAPSPNQISGAAAVGKRGFGVTRVKTFAIGGWKKEGVNFAVLELADWGLGMNGKVLNSLGGILGGDVLLGEAALIDCGQLKLWLHGRK